MQQRARTAGQVDSHGAPAVQQWAKLLVQRRPGAQPVELGLGAGGDVPLDAGVREQRREQPQPEVDGATGGVGNRRADMRADQLGWQQQAGPALDQLTLDGVVGI